MEVAGPPQLERSTETPGFPDPALIEAMERLPDPAVLYLPGSRIAAVTTAAARLSDFDAIGKSMCALIGSSESRRADGSRLLPGNLPFSRALRGDVVDQGERIDIVLPGGSVYRAVVTSAPVVRDGKVVAALSVWHDFDGLVRGLARGMPEG